MAFPVFLLLLLGTGEGLEPAAPRARGSRAGSRAGGEVPGQGDRSGVPFKVGTGGYRSQWHPGSRDIVASPGLPPGCSDPGLVVPRKVGTWGLRLRPLCRVRKARPRAGLCRDQPEQAVPGARRLECRCVPVSTRTPGSPPVPLAPAAPAENLPGSCLCWPPARPGSSGGRGDTPACHPQQGGLYWVAA